MNSISISSVVTHRLKRAVFVTLMAVSYTLPAQKLPNEHVKKSFTPPVPVTTVDEVEVQRVSKEPAIGRTVELKLPVSPDNASIEAFQGMIEPLRPVTDGSTPQERAALATALKRWMSRTVTDDMGALEDFIDAHPNSPWAPSLHLNLGGYNYHSGRFSKALTHWNAAWTITRGMKGAEATAIANAAIAEYSLMLARIGRMEELSDVLNSVKNRNFQNSTLVLIERAREGLWSMKNKPGVSFRCGPYALNLIQTAKTGAPVEGFMEKIVPLRKGFR